MSLIIENQNEVQIDESYLEQCKVNNEKQPSKPISAVSKMLSNKEIKLNKNYVSKKKSLSPSPLSSKNLSCLNSDNRVDSEELNELKKMETRLDSLEDYQKRMEENLGKEFF